MISEGRVTALYNPAGPESYTPVNHAQAGNAQAGNAQAGNVQHGNTDATSRNTVKEPRIGGGSSQNV